MMSWNRSGLRGFRKPVAGLLSLLMLITPALGWAADDSSLRERMARLISGQSGGRIESRVVDRMITLEAKRSAYSRTFTPRSRGYARARISVRVGGVLVGRPPDADDGQIAEPLGVPEFDYEILKPEGDRGPRVKMDFGTAGGDRWSITVPAGVVTPMTAVAVDGRPVLYTLTGSRPPESLFGALLEATSRTTPGLLVHPGIDGHRLVFRPAVIDLFADGRVPPALQGEILTTQFTVALFESAAAFYNDPNDKKAKAKLEATFEVLGKLRLALMRVPEVAGNSTSETEREKRVLSSVEMLTENKEFVSSVEGKLRGPSRVYRANGLSDFITEASKKKTFGEKVDMRSGATVLSVVEERPWTLAPEHLKSPDVIKDPSSSIAQFKQRFAYDDIDDLGEDEVKDLFAELEVSKVVHKAVTDGFTATDLQLLQEFNDALIVHRIIASVLQRRIINFPEDKWEAMVRELGDTYRANLDADQQKVRTRASLWHSVAKLHRQDKDMVAPPRIPDDLRLR